MTTACLQATSRFDEACRAIRGIIVETAFRSSQSAHIGGSLSMVELLHSLYGSILVHRPHDPQWIERDIFILSKGHAVLGYLATLHYHGYFDQDVLRSFQTDGSALIAHPVKNVALGIESSNGSLGQGLAYGMGMAIGMGKRGQGRRVYVLLGDGECNEGSVWESAASAAELGVANLTAVIDENGFRNDGPTSTYSGAVSLAKIWGAFGWQVIPVDGHSQSEISDAFAAARAETRRPTAIVARTVKGKGIPIMEGNNEWHHSRITANGYAECLQALGLQQPARAFAES